MANGFLGTVSTETKRPRGRPKTGPNTVQLKLNVHPEIAAAIRANGGSRWVASLVREKITGTFAPPGASG